MKRHPALQDLSRDHHAVLVRLQRLRRALAGKTPWGELRPLMEGLLGFYASDLRAHFQEEDEIVVPAAEAAGGPALRAVAGAVRAEHEAFQRTFGRLRRARSSEEEARALLAELEPAVTAHVHVEEEELFEGVQAALDEPALAALGLRSRRFRRRNRSPEACGVPASTGARPPTP